MTGNEVVNHSLRQANIMMSWSRKESRPNGKQGILTGYTKKLFN